MISIWDICSSGIAMVGWDAKYCWCHNVPCKQPLPLALEQFRAVMAIYRCSCALLLLAEMASISEGPLTWHTAVHAVHTEFPAPVPTPQICLSTVPTSIMTDIENLLIPSQAEMHNFLDFWMEEKNITERPN